MMRSAGLARVMRLAEQRWFSTALRARLDDGRREEWKGRFVARAVSLIARWSSPDLRRLRAREKAVLQVEDQDIDGCHQALSAAGIADGSLIEKVEDLIEERDRLAAIEEAATVYMAAKLDPRADTNGPRSALCDLLDAERIYTPRALGRR